jgi:disulfide oxidoreductase YuzD
MEFNYHALILTILESHNILSESKIGQLLFNPAFDITKEGIEMLKQANTLSLINEFLTEFEIDKDGKSMTSRTYPNNKFEFEGIELCGKMLMIGYMHYPNSVQNEDRFYAIHLIGFDDITPGKWKNTTYIEIAEESKDDNWDGTIIEEWNLPTFADSVKTSMDGIDDYFRDND